MTALDDNIQKLDRYLARFRETGISNRIAGKDRKGSGGTFEAISPVDKSLICQVARADESDVD
ncbi:MAG: 5-carboxymethyl-2-hydroxymuconate semialdehyde dehydrogenase, partial [Woeseiaceae bacterium]|nr:5-carboxymethyl-2-hydroxymuconate semialdehyde dehydrogenase [Woeseiaceae bacterium]